MSPNGNSVKSWEEGIYFTSIGVAVIWEPEGLFTYSPTNNDFRLHLGCVISHFIDLRHCSMVNYEGKIHKS